MLRNICSGVGSAIGVSLIEEDGELLVEAQTRVHSVVVAVNKIVRKIY